MRTSARAWTVAILCGLASAQSELPRLAPTSHNVLVIVADDVGCDMVRCFSGRGDGPSTPALDALAARGVRFERAYANPWCSPTRAALLTGRYSFRTGIGYPINQATDGFALADDELTLPEFLERALGRTLDTSAIGKWHLSRFSDLDGPRRQGFDWFEGSLGNLVGEDGYFARQEVRNGERVPTSRYATVEEADDAIARLGAMREPWLLYLAFNSAHEPFHAPPRESSGVAFEPGSNPSQAQLYAAMVQSLDHEVGRVLAALGPELGARTNVVFLGDNGTPMDALEDKYKRARSKGTLFEGGIRVPLIIAGPSVSGAPRVCDELVGAVDLFATIAGMFGVEQRAFDGLERELDSLSFMPLLRDPQASSARRFLLAEEFRPNGHGARVESHVAVFTRSAKLGVTLQGEERFFDLSDRANADRPIKIPALTSEQKRQYEELKAELERLTRAR